MVQRPLKTKQPPTAVNAHPSTSLAAPTTSTSTTLGQITFTQSLSVVRTMMAVSFGCIAYLRFVRLCLPPSCSSDAVLTPTHLVLGRNRGLLPEENFSDNSTHSLSGQLGSSSQDKKGVTGASEGKGGLKVKTIKRNYSCVPLFLFCLSPSLYVVLWRVIVGGEVKRGSLDGELTAGVLVWGRMCRPEGDKLLDYLVRPSLESLPSEARDTNCWVVVSLQEKGVMDAIEKKVRPLPPPSSHAPPNSPLLSPFWWLTTAVPPRPSDEHLHGPGRTL